MLSNCEMLLNEVKMASLNDLLKRFNEVNGRLIGQEQRLNDAKEKMKEYNEIIAQQKQIISDATAQKNLGEKTLKIYNKEEQPENPGEIVPETVANAWKEELPKLEEKIKAAQNKIEEQNLLIAGAASIKEEIEADKQELDSIMTQFAADPVINEHLQSAIDMQYDGKITIQEQKAERLTAQKNQLIDGLTNDAELKEKVSKLKELAGEYAVMSSQMGAAIMRRENSEKLNKTIRSIDASKNELRKSIEAKYQIKLTDEDFEKIIETQEGETYQIPSVESEISKVEDVKKGIETRREKAKTAIKEALNRSVDPTQRKQELEGLIGNEATAIANAEQEIAKEAGEIKTLEEQIVALEAQFSSDISAEEQEYEAKKAAFENAEKEEKAKNDEIEELDSEIGELDTQMSSTMTEEDKERLAELEGKVPAELLERKKQLTEEIKALNDDETESITKEDIERLKNANINFKTLKDKFNNADLMLREAFVRCQTCQPEELEKAKLELSKAMEDYKKASETLARATNFSVKQWHNYLLETKNNRLANGKDVEDVYFAENMENKLEIIKNTYPEAFKEDGEATTRYNGAIDASKAIMDLQEKVLSGEDVDFNHITGKVDGYRNVMESLFEKIKAKSFNTLSGIKDLFGLISGNLKVRGKFNLFKWFGNLGRSLFGKKQNTISGYTENTKASEKERKQIELYKVKREIDSKFEESELEELKTLRQKNEQYEVLSQTHSDKRTARDEKAGELVGLTNKKATAKTEMETAQQAFEDAKNKAGKATPEQESQLRALKANKEKAKARQRAAETRKRAAETRKRTYEYEHEDTGVVKGSTKINHDSKNEYREMRKEAFDRFDEDERE